MKIFIILLSALFLAGCQIEFYVIFKNGSDKKVEFISRNDAKTIDVVEPGETEKVHISRGCQIVKIGESTGYLDFSKVPKSAWTSINGGSEIRCEISYTTSGLLLKTNGDEFYQIEVQKYCNN